MSDAPPAAASAPPLAVDPQDPLPETNWFWRRIFIGAVMLALLAFRYWHAQTLGQIALSTNVNTPKGAIIDAIHGLVSLLQRDQLLEALIVLLYIAGASMEQVTKLVQTSSLLKNVPFTSTSRATAPDGSTAEATTTAGTPAPPVPPSPPPPPVAPAREIIPDYAR